MSMIHFQATQNINKFKTRKVSKNTKILEDLISESYDSKYQTKNLNLEDVPGIEKELFMVLDIDRPQFNLQNEINKSQMLIEGKGNMRMSLYTFLIKDPINVKKKYSIKKQILCRFEQINAYVAPTTINIVSPTFWCYDNMFEKDMANAKTEDDYEQMGDLLRSIMKTKKVHFDVDIFNKDFCDHTKPLINISIKIIDIKAWFTPQNWWHMVFVLQSILFATGEKSMEQELLDKYRTDELQMYKADLLKTLIHRKLSKMVSQFDISNRPMIDKKIEWNIKHGDLELYEDTIKFSDIELSDFVGSFVLYSNKETKCDVDIHRVLIENHCDPEAYRLVLYPGYSLKNPQRLDHMVKIRIRDKFIITKDAPWKVFDQFEIFLNSMSVTLTRKFYNKLQLFMLHKQEKDKNTHLQTMEEEQKINMLMPSRYTVADNTIEDQIEVAELTNRRTEGAKDVNSASLRDIDSPDSNEEEEKGDFLESTTSNFRKAQALKSKNPPDNKSVSFSLNNLGKMITNKVRTMRNYKSKNKDEQVAKHPLYFRYFRINEIGVSLTYKHSENSFLNTKNLRIIIKPFIKHGKFITFQKMLNKYESFCKRSLVYQIPSIVKQKLLKITLSKEDDDLEDEIEDDLKSMKSRTILFGNYAKI